MVAWEPELIEVSMESREPSIMGTVESEPVDGNMPG